MNLHFHTPVLDGVFTDAPGSALAFHPTPAPSDAEVAAVLGTKVASSTSRSALAPEASAVGRVNSWAMREKPKRVGSFLGKIAWPCSR